ncbi:MAG: UbiA family prenyltransferase [Planctomycetota bacterium]
MDSSDQSATPLWLSWARLVRLPTVFSAMACTASGFLLISGFEFPLPHLIVVLASVTALYWSGMILNDVCDIDEDRRLNRAGPLVTGEISVRTAQLAVVILMSVGVALAWIAGNQAEEFDQLPVIISVVIGGLVWLYDAPLKSTLLAPAVMGACRGASFLLGSSVALPLTQVETIPEHVLSAALGFTLYVMGLTLFGRREAAAGEDAGGINLAVGLVVLVGGLLIMAFGPTLTGFEQRGVRLDSRIAFPLLIGLIGGPVIVRFFKAIRDPDPSSIGPAMRLSILTIVPLSAAHALLGAGPSWGFAVFFLSIPGLILSAKIRVT